MSTDTREFITLDVFTDQRFGGNPLAIVPNATGLDDATMQRVAAEANLSETVFLHHEPGNDTPSLRIFTPKSELPFAGHPTVGTAIYLAEEKGLASGTTLNMLTLAGPVAAGISRNESGLTVAEVKAPQAPICRAAASIESCAAALSLAANEIAAAPRICDAGNPFTVIPVSSREALARAHLNAAAWAAGPGATDAAKLFIVFIENLASGGVIHTRMFAPSIGITEDPATGSAAVALPALLHELQPLADGEHRWQIRQGDDMGRPSAMAVRAVAAGGRLTAAYVGGTAVRVINGSIQIR